MGRLLHDHVVDGAQRAPMWPAAIGDGGPVSYGRLDERSTRIAHLLRAHGCRRGDPVVVCSAAPADTLAEQVGVLKAGCAYVPDEPDGRAVHRARIIRHARPRVVLFSGCDPRVLDDLRLRGVMSAAATGWLGPDGAAMEVDFTNDDVDLAPAEGSYPDGKEDDQAIVLYASRGKGADPVRLTHGAVRSLAEWAVDYFALSPADRVCAHHPPVSGISALYTWAALAAGAQVHQVPTWLHRWPHEFPRFAASRSLTVWSSAASHLEYAIRFGGVEGHALSSLRHVAWTGSGLPAPALLEWRKRLPGATLTRFYAPRSHALPISHYRVPADFDDPLSDVPVGDGLGDHELTVLDEQLRPAAKGRLGSVCARMNGSTPVRTGHRGRRGPDGFVRLADAGDLQLPDGLSELGTAGLENAILELEGVAACAIIPLPPGDPSPNRIACAYVTSNGRPLRESEARRRLGEHLPADAIPSRWLRLPELPIDRWGRIDRARASALLGG